MPVATNNRRITTPTPDALHPVGNGAEAIIAIQVPYIATVTIQGTKPFLFHVWNPDAIEEKRNSPKGSRGKKQDDPETYVARTDDGDLAIPGEYLRRAIVQAAKYQQDPRSPKKSAMDLFNEGLIALDELCSLGVKQWDKLDRRRATVQRDHITRTRPALYAGWQITCRFEVLLPEYISPANLNRTIQDAGRLKGIGDFRPTFGRFQVVRFDATSNQSHREHSRGVARQA